jgi:octopine/nopaline transport system ATP-binding protein
MTSQTIARILDAHAQNTLLNTPAPPLMAHSAGDLSADDLFAPIDERMIESAANALESGQTHYVDVPGIAALRAAIADHLTGTYGGDYAQPNVIVTAGMQEARFLTLQMIGETVERVAVPKVVHPGVRKALGVRALSVDMLDVDADMLPTLATIRATLQRGSSLLYLESPSRLTGAVYNAETVVEIATLAAAYDAIVIWDQGLAPWVDGYTSLAAHTNHTVAIGEAFPGSGLGSWLVGYIAAPERLIAPMQSQKQIMAICTATAAQYAALEASKLYAEAQPGRRARLKIARQAAVDALGDRALPGAAANILAVRSTAVGTLQAANGADFGAPGVLRMTVSVETQLPTQAILGG